jgi:hypothetical protein
MLVRLKVVRRKEQQISKVRELMQMFNVPGSNSNYPIGGSSLRSNSATPADPKIQKTIDLFQMFHLVR